ncbi:putative reverse transcriptase domain-containing protein, partial [Tanacetum coccineum]
YRELHKLTTKNLPSIDDLFDQLQGSRYFSKIDLRSSCHQLRVHEEDIPKTAYRTREQEESFQTLKDNLCNAPILSLPDGPEDCVVYCDASNQGLGCVLMQRGKAQTKWIELFSDFDSEIRYHPRKANVVADALSKASKVENATAEMLRGLDQQIERKEDGADKTYYNIRDMYGGHV